LLLLGGAIAGLGWYAWHSRSAAPVAATDQTAGGDTTSGEPWLAAPGQAALVPSAGLTGSLIGLPAGATAHVTVLTITGSYEIPSLVAEQDSTGVYGFSSLVPGKYCIAASSDDLAGSVCGIDLGADQTIQKDIQMLSAGLVLGGTIFDAEGGTVPSAVVMVQGDDNSVYGAHALADGSYSLRVPQGGYSVTVHADGYVEVVKYIEVAGATRLDFQLNPAATLFGHVLYGESQAPAAGAVVSATDDDSQVWNATADATGAFSLTSLRPGHYSLSAQLGTMVGAPPQPFSLHLGESQNVGNIVLQPGASVGGTVLDDESGRPIAGAKVTREDQESAAPAITDAQGRFTLEGFLPGHYTLLATADGHAGAESDDIFLGGGQKNGIELRLGPGATIHGVVSLKNGDPAVGVEMSADPGATGGPDVTTDDKGRYTLQGLATGSEYVSAYSSEGEADSDEIDLAAGDDKEVDLTLDGSAKGSSVVTGTVRYTDGRPAAGALIEAYPSDSGGNLNATADQSGHYELDKVPAGELEITASRPGARPYNETEGTDATITVTVEDGRATDGADLTLTGGQHTISGTVVDQAGKPISGAGVSAYRMQVASASEGDGDLAGDEPGQADPGGEPEEDIDDGSYDDEGYAADPGDIDVYSNPDGTFTLSGLADGSYSVYADEPDYLEGKAGPIAADATGVRLVMKTTATLSGVVLNADGSPAQSYELSWDGSTDGDDASYSSGDRMVNDANGRFTITGLPDAAEVDLTVTTPDDEVGEGQSNVGDNDVTIQLTQTSTVKGRLLGSADGKPVAGFGVALQGQDGSDDDYAYATTDDDGTFTMTQVKPGNYVLTVDDDGTPLQQSVSVSDGQEVDLGDVMADAAAIQSGEGEGDDPEEAPDDDLGIPGPPSADPAPSTVDPVEPGDQPDQPTDQPSDTQDQTDPSTVTAPNPEPAAVSATPSDITRGLAGGA
jgi:protocatechuate 3,4-dioxygenase beta subunit